MVFVNKPFEEDINDPLDFFLVGNKQLEAKLCKNENLDMELKLEILLHSRGSEDSDTSLCNDDAGMMNYFFPWF